MPDLGVEPQAFLGNLGLTGGTAYFGLLDAAQAKEGDIVFVSAAAGAVGSAVVQIAKAKGMTVIGSAGGADKCDFVRSLGADAVIDYKAGPLLKQLAAAAPKGIDVYFDNVGGDHLDAAFALARHNARFAICGMIDGYNSGEPTRLRYIMRDHRRADPHPGLHLHRLSAARWANSTATWARWIASGQVKSRDTVVDGLEADPRSLPRPVQRRQHRQDAGQAVSRSSPGDMHERQACL